MMNPEVKMEKHSEKIVELEKILLTGNIKNTYKDYHLSDENKCNFLFCFHGGFFQKLASKKVFIVLYGSAIFMLFAKMAYLNATITTLEKRFQIPTQNSGMIIGCFDIMSIISPVICHTLSKRCRPRWLSFFMLMLACHCFFMVALNSFYGPGEPALSLTVEYGGNFTTLIKSESEHNTALCYANSSLTNQSDADVSHSKPLAADYGYFPQIFLFINQIFGGTFNSIFETLASSYLDDNTMKSKVPFVFSVINFFRLMAPMFGYNLAAFCLSKYIAFDVTPLIDSSDNRWLGAWWYGWIILGVGFTILTVLFAGVPKEMPRAAIRRKIALLTDKVNKTSKSKMDSSMRATFGRIVKNKIFWFNTISATGSFFGLVPYFIYSIKYIEVQYRESAANSSFYIGTVTQIFSIIGTLFSGWALYRFKPTARMLVLWNMTVGILSVTASLSYTFLGCSDISNSIQISNVNLTDACLWDCNCDNAKYTPICGDNGVSYLTPCDAGCLDQIHFDNGTIRYDNCSCIGNNGSAISGLCTANCKTELYTVITFMCMTSFLQSASKMSIFLICLRCVSHADKAVALAMFATIFSYCAMIPSPILFGWIVDQTCIFWEKTAGGEGNCWAYDEDAFRFWFNTVAAGFLAAGLIFGDLNVFRYAKHLQIFDEEDEKVDDSKYEPVKITETNFEQSQEA